VSNTEFEGGDDGHGLGDHTFLAKQAQPSHKPLFSELNLYFDLDEAASKVFDPPS
jgi:hypothetical protein